MANFSKIPKYAQIGVLLFVMGLLVLGIENLFDLDESLLLASLYLLPIGCFFSSFVAFIFAGIHASNN